MPTADALNGIFDILQNGLFIPLTTDVMFLRGFCWALLVAGIVGGVSRAILFRWRKIQAFFKPSQLPATVPGPSGYQRMNGCFTSALGLLALGLGAIALLVAGELF